MPVRQTTQYTYGITEKIISLAPMPISADRDPTTNDFAPLGTVWINRTAQTIWQLGGLSNNTANWQTAPGAAVGNLTSLTVNPGDINVTLGDINVAAGNITLAGTLTAVDVTADTVESDQEITVTTGTPVGATTAVRSLALAGGPSILTGAGAPNNAAAVAIGDLYINTTNATATTRLYIATAVGTWTNITCAA